MHEPAHRKQPPGPHAVILLCRKPLSPFGRRQIRLFDRLVRPGRLAAAGRFYGGLYWYG